MPVNRRFLPSRLAGRSAPAIVSTSRGLGASSEMDFACFRLFGLLIGNPGPSGVWVRINPALPLTPLSSSRLGVLRAQSLQADKMTHPQSAGDSIGVCVCVCGGENQASLPVKILFFLQSQPSFFFGGGDKSRPWVRKPSPPLGYTDLAGYFLFLSCCTPGWAITPPPHPHPEEKIGLLCKQAAVSSDQRRVGGETRRQTRKWRVDFNTPPSLAASSLKKLETVKLLALQVRWENALHLHRPLQWSLVCRTRVAAHVLHTLRLKPLQVVELLESSLLIQ